MALVARTAICAFALLAAAGPALAQFHVGIAAGASHIDINCANTTACDRNGTGAKLYGGVRVATDAALELTLHRWGEVDATGPAALAGRLKGSGWGIGGAYFVALPAPWSAVARAGVASNKTEISGAWGGFNSADSKTRYSLYGGVGASYRLSPALSIDVALDVSRVKYSGEVAYARLVSIGASFHH